MKEDFISISLWIIFPLFIILGSMLSACSPFEIKEAEKVSEEIVEDISQEALKD
jgi:hypothetical protein